MTKEEKLEALERVAILAGAIVLETPERHAPHTFNAYVSYSALSELSAALDAAGYDVARARKKLKELTSCPPS